MRSGLDRPLPLVFIVAFLQIDAVTNPFVVIAFAQIYNLLLQIRRYEIIGPVAYG